MKTLLFFLVLLLLVGCGQEPTLTSEILDNYETAFTQGYIWAAGVIVRDEIITPGDLNQILDAQNHNIDLYDEAFVQGTFHAFDYATTKINTRDTWLHNRLNFLRDSLRTK